MDSYVELDDDIVDAQVAHMLPEEVVRRVNMLPFRIAGGQLHVATTAPVDLFGIDEIRLLTGIKITPIIVSKKELARAIDQQFSIRQTSKQAIIDMRLRELGAAAESDQMEQPDTEGPVVALVNSIIRGAVSDRSSDIHLEPQYPEMRVRYRINGILHNITTIPGYISPSIISRIKLMADMDITERRRPQDGHISIDIEDRQIDLRVSTALTVNGEKIVMRVLDKETMLIDLEYLGLSGKQQNIFREMIARPHGMILITGPTGSGKTTSLYAILQQLDSTSKNIVTIENPVEYKIANINQIQVNPYVDITFATALRTIVRQDPDVIMVGEIRDFETADTAIQASLTGHLVFSTLHANDAPGTLVRLLDMGVQPFSTASAVVGVAAQRLVRTICPECKELYRPDKEEVELLELSDDSGLMLARGKGCNFCFDTGYRGRTGIFEVLKIDDSIRELILARAPATEIGNTASAKGMKSLRDAGKEKVIQGITTVEEIRRATYAEKDAALKPKEILHAYADV